MWLYEARKESFLCKVWFYYPLQNPWESHFYYTSLHISSSVLFCQLLSSMVIIGGIYFYFLEELKLKRFLVNSPSQTFPFFWSAGCLSVVLCDVVSDNGSVTVMLCKLLGNECNPRLIVIQRLLLQKYCYRAVNRMAFHVLREEKTFLKIRCKTSRMH